MAGRASRLATVPVRPHTAFPQGLIASAAGVHARAPSFLPRTYSRVSGGPARGFAASAGAGNGGDDKDGKEEEDDMEGDEDYEDDDGAEDYDMFGEGEDFSKDDRSHWLDRELDGEPAQGAIHYPPVRARVGRQWPFWSAPACIEGKSLERLTSDDYLGMWKILFFYPKDFTFVCPSEIIAFNDRAAEFRELGCELIAASCDTEEVHLAWCRTPRSKGGLGKMDIPILADVTKSISAEYGVLDEAAGFPLRGLFLVDPHDIIQHITVNAAPVGRSVDEALRTLQAFQFNAEHGEVCPANWKPGEATMVADPNESLEYFEAHWSDNDNNAGSTSSRMEVVNSEKGFAASVIEGSKGKGKKPVLVKYEAPWCGKCRQIQPFVDEMAEKYAHGLTFVAFDPAAAGVQGAMVDGHPGAGKGSMKEHPMLADHGLPTFRIFVDGEPVDEVVGYKKRQLESMIQAHIPGQ